MEHALSLIEYVVRFNTQAQSGIEYTCSLDDILLKIINVSEVMRIVPCPA